MIHYFRQPVLSKPSLIPLKNHVSGEREVYLFIHAHLRWTFKSTDRAPLPSAVLPAAPSILALGAAHVLGHVRREHSCLSLCPSSPARLPPRGCGNSSCNVGKAQLPSRNIIPLPDTQRECVEAEAVLVFQGERKNHCHGHKYVVWTVTQGAGARSESSQCCRTEQIFCLRLKRQQRISRKRSLAA